MSYKVVHMFTPAELAGIAKRRQEIIKFITAIAEIRGLPENLQVSADERSLVIEVPDEEGEK